MSGMVLHDIDVSAASDYTRETGLGDHGNDISGTNINDIVQFTPTQDVTVVAVQLDLIFDSAVLSATTPSTQTADNVSVQLSVRDTFDTDGDSPGIWWEKRLRAVRGVVFEDETNGTGGGAGGNPHRLSLVFDPSRLEADVSAALNGGQSLSVHSRTLDTMPDEANVDVMLRVWFIEGTEGVTI